MSSRSIRGLCFWQKIGLQGNLYCAKGCFPEPRTSRSLAESPESDTGKGTWQFRRGQTIETPPGHVSDSVNQQSPRKRLRLSEAVPPTEKRTQLQRVGFPHQGCISIPSLQDAKWIISSGNMFIVLSFRVKCLGLRIQVEQNRQLINTVLYVFVFFKKDSALTGVAHWIEYWPVNQRITGSIPSQGTCLGCRPGPW